MRSRMRVDTEELLAIVKQRRDQMVKAYRADMAKYEKDLPRYRKRLAAHLRKVARDIEDGGKLPDRGYRGQVEVKVPFRGPSKPSLDTSQIDRDLRTLALAAEPSISISEQDARHYLG